MPINPDVTDSTKELISALPYGAAALLDAIPVATVLFDSNLSIRHRNAPAKTLLGPGSTVPTILEPACDTEVTKNWESELHDLLTTGRGRCYDAVAYAPSGASAKRLDIRITPLRDETTGVVAGGVLTAENVTSVEHPEWRIDGHARLGGSDTLVARVAHELNNPLDGILRYINLALRRLDKPGSEKVADYLRESRKGLRRMVQIIADLLVYSRTSHDGAPEVNVNAIVEEAVRSLQDRAIEAGVVITASYRDKHMPAIGGTKLYQVCCNLIKNALDAMASGGMLTIDTGVVDSTVVLRFEDTGDGLPEELDKIFEPFYTTKDSEHGTGLGLAICKEFVEQLGGSIKAGHREGGGAVFTVKFPVDPEVAS